MINLSYDVPIRRFVRCKSVNTHTNGLFQNTSGQDWFVGCTGWKPGDENGSHVSVHPQPGVSLKHYKKMEAGEQIPEAIGKFENCNYITTARSGKKSCGV